MELFTEFTTGYWWGVVELFSKFTTGYWWGRGTVYRVHHGLLVGGCGTVFQVHHGLLVGVVVIGGCRVARSFIFCALFSDSDYPFGVFKLFLFFKLI